MHRPFVDCYLERTIFRKCSSIERLCETIASQPSIDFSNNLELHITLTDNIVLWYVFFVNGSCNLKKRANNVIGFENFNFFYTHLSTIYTNFVRFDLT